MTLLKIDVLLIREFKELIITDYKDNLKDLNNFNLKNSKDSDERAVCKLKEFNINVKVINLTEWFLKRYNIIYSNNVLL